MKDTLVFVLLQKIDEPNTCLVFSIEWLCQSRYEEIFRSLYLITKILTRGRYNNYNDSKIYSIIIKNNPNANSNDNIDNGDRSKNKNKNINMVDWKIFYTQFRNLRHNTKVAY